MARRFGDPHRDCEWFTTGDDYPENATKTRFGAKFSGDNYTRCGATPPWTYGFYGFEVFPNWNDWGVWFIDPLRYHRDYNNKTFWENGERYIYNPYLYSLSGCPPDCGYFPSPLNIYFDKYASSYRIQRGESVTYYYYFENRGVVPIRNVYVYDDSFGTVCTLSYLGPGQSHTCQRTATLYETETNEAKLIYTYWY